MPGAAGLPPPDYASANEGDEGYRLFLLDVRTLKWALAKVGKLVDPLTYSIRQVVPSRCARRVAAPRLTSRGLPRLNQWPSPQ